MTSSLNALEIELLWRRLAKLFGQSPGMWILQQLAHDYYAAFQAADADMEQIVPVGALAR